MTFTESIKSFWSKYFVFSGRASRSEYWWAILHLVLISLVISIVDGIINPATLDPDSTEVGVLASIFSLATLIPSFSIAWRRFHDAGFSGWWIAGSMIAGVAFIIGSIGLIMDVTLNPSVIELESYQGQLALFGLGLFAFMLYSLFMLIVTILPSKPDNKWGKVAAKTVATAVEVIETPIADAEAAGKQNVKDSGNELTTDKIAKVKELNQMKADGMITEEEYAALKKKELGL